MEDPGEAALEASSELEATLSGQGPVGREAPLSRSALEELRSTGTTSVQALVVVGDLRMSTLVLKEALAPSAFARFVVGFTESVRSLVRDSDGWFDKFTGDGFVAFWLLPEPPRIDAVRLARFCQTVLPAADALLRNLRRTSRNFPAGVGLALGVDAGPCELVRVGGSLTLVGSPIVGATRMVATATARQTIVNNLVGNALEVDSARLEAERVRLARIVVRTQEFPEGQEAYRLDLPELPAPLRPRADQPAVPGDGPQPF